MNTHHRALEFHAIIDKLQGHALSDKAREILGRTEPSLNEDVCVRKMAETTAARRILDSCGSPPLPSMKGLLESVTLAVQGAMLMPEQLTVAAQFSASCKRMTAYLSRGESVDGTVAMYGRSIPELKGLREEIERCIHGETVCDDASPALKDLRRRANYAETQIKEKLGALLNSRREYLADSFYTIRGGRYVLPVQKRFRSNVEGTVVEASGKGSTVFIEPAAISKLQAELTSIAIEEDGEVRRVLYMLSSEVAERAPEINYGIEAMETLDVLFAKAKLSAEMKAVPCGIGGERKIKIIKGRHPLLDAEKCVPLDFDMQTSGVIITGPNTGGKTVAIKTVGLLSLMAQSGLHIPCGEGSYIAMQDAICCDIGDSQNISQNLSTFSGHISNIINILENASGDSLIILDELGSGTDPAEGMGIAIAVLEELRRRGCMFLVTTHYPQVKSWTETAEGIVSARMAFDRESLNPLYILEMGVAGESCALHIARRLGLPEHLLARASREVYGETQHDSEQAKMKAPKSGLTRKAAKIETPENPGGFQVGDSVTLLQGGEIGVVYKPADENGDVIVQVKGVKSAVRHNRLKLKVSAAELYPPDYDFSIIFDPAEHRKARKQMGKHHDPDLVLRY